MGVGIFKIIAVAFLFVLALSTASACSIDFSSVNVELQSDTDTYDDSINAEDGSDIDIRVSFDVDDFSGSNCSDDLEVDANLYRRESSSDSWTLFDTTSTKTESLDEDNFEFTWNNEFEINDTYSEYKVVGIIGYDGNDFETAEATIDVESNESCSDIEVTATSFTMDEDDTIVKTFRIENNSNEDFEIDTIFADLEGSIVDVTDAEYDDTVAENDSIDVRVEFTSDSVSSDIDIDGTFSVEGTLGNETCRESDIDEDTFTVTVDNSGSSSSSTSSSSDCDDLLLVVKDFEMSENSESTQIFYLSNDSTKRFEITGVSLTSNGVDLRNYYNEQYVFPSEVADIVIKANAPNVFSNKVYENIIKVKGQFSDGKTCSYDKIVNKTFNVAIADDSTSASFATCSNFTITAPASVSFENFGTVPISITNGTNQRADIYIEGTVEASITQISLPANSSVSREINVSLIGSSGSLTLRPSVSGCNFSSKTVTINNTASGELSSLTMSVTTTTDTNNGNITIFVEINNPTSKIFPGVLSISAPSGWYSDDKEITVTPGKNSFTTTLVRTSNAESGDIIVKFKTQNGEISSTITPENSGLIGLFALGGVGSLLALILIIVVVLVIVGIISSPTEAERKEEWMENNN